MIFFIASKVDEAGLNIANRLIETFGFKETGEKIFGNIAYSIKLKGSEEARLVFVDREPVDVQDLPYPKNLRMIIFISRHSSKSGKPTLSVHTPGNIGEAALGGEPRKVSISPASAKSITTARAGANAVSISSRRVTACWMILRPCLASTGNSWATYPKSAAVTLRGP